MDRFTDNISDHLKNYVYRLIDPRNGQTFYVGRGKGNRVFSHVNTEINIDQEDTINLKYKQIREIRLAGLEVIHVIHRHGLDEKSCIEVESALIDAYPAITNEINGEGSSDFGPMNSKEIIDLYSLSYLDFKHNVVMITVNNTAPNRDLYDATRFAWKINIKRAKTANFILSVQKGVVKEVYEVSEWKMATIDNFPEFNLDLPLRFGFKGNLAPQEIREYYNNKKIPEKYRKKGASNPVKYNF